MMKIAVTESTPPGSTLEVRTKHGKRRVTIPEDAPDAEGKVVVYPPVADNIGLAEPQPVPTAPVAAPPPMAGAAPQVGTALPGQPPVPAPSAGPPSARKASSPPKVVPHKSRKELAPELSEEFAPGSPRDETLPERLARKKKEYHQQGGELTDEFFMKEASIYAKKQEAKNKTKEWINENEEHIKSINTIAAWLLMPSLDREANGWFKQKYWWQYTLSAILFTALQCLVVTAMISDGKVRVARGDFADEEVLPALAPLLIASMTPEAEALGVKYGLPPRDVKYCKIEVAHLLRWQCPCPKPCAQRMGSNCCSLLI
eukprot:COSAG05_NODE_1188_length_5580_cov_3.406495_4_plen_315_part_00